MNKIIFFGNGPLADYTKSILEQHFDIIFHARTKEDLEKIKEIKAKNKDAHGVLASFGVMIKSDVLDIFEPEGILNIHPSLLPKYRGASPIESAILNCDDNFSVSIMKLVKGMDAGPIYYQETITPDNINRPDLKDYLYKTLSEKGANWIVHNIDNLNSPEEQNEEGVSFTEKFDKSISFLTPKKDSTIKTLRKIQAFQNFPKAKYTFYNQECIILEAHIIYGDELALIKLECQDGALSIDKLQPAGKKPMDAKSFLNGYAK